MSKPTLVALVTGGGRGIGRAIAIRMAKDTPVLIVGRTEDKLRKTALEIKAAGGVAAVVVGDVTQSATINKLGEVLTARNWEVGSLVLNAGIGKSGASETYPLSDFQKVYELNVFAALELVKLCAPKMIECRSGSIVFMSSVAGLKGLSHDAAYVSSKHAEVGLARALAVEYGKHGICVVPVCPSFVESEMTDQAIASIAKRRNISLADARNVIEKATPQRRIITAEEVAEVVAFIASGKAPSLSGNPLILGGGGL